MPLLAAGGWRTDFARPSSAGLSTAFARRRRLSGPWAVSASSAVAPPAAMATAKPPEGPKRSTVPPETEAPSATPTLRPVIAQVIPSVRAAGGTVFSTSPITTIMVGAKKRPEKKTAAESVAMSPTSSRGSVVRAVPAVLRSSSRGSGTVSRRAPKTSPAPAEPIA